MGEGEGGGVQDKVLSDSPSPSSPPTLGRGNLGENMPNELWTSYFSRWRFLKLFFLSQNLFFVNRFFKLGITVERRNINTTLLIPIGWRQ